MDCSVRTIQSTIIENFTRSLNNICDGKFEDIAALTAAFNSLIRKDETPQFPAALAERIRPLQEMLRNVQALPLNQHEKRDLDSDLNTIVARKIDQLRRLYRDQQAEELLSKYKEGTSRMDFQDYLNEKNWPQGYGYLDSAMRSSPYQTMVTEFICCLNDIPPQRAENIEDCVKALSSLLQSDSTLPTSIPASCVDWMRPIEEKLRVFTAIPLVESEQSHLKTHLHILIVRKIEALRLFPNPSDIFRRFDTQDWDCHDY
jgi:hypothetical protein